MRLLSECARVGVIRHMDYRPEREDTGNRHAARSRTFGGYLLGVGMVLPSRLDQAFHRARGKP